MRFKSKLDPDNPVQVEATKVAICNWYDNNDAAFDAPAMDPSRLTFEREGDWWAVHYLFIGTLPALIGWCDEEPE